MLVNGSIADIELLILDSTICAIWSVFIVKVEMENIPYSDLAMNMAAGDY